MSDDAEIVICAAILMPDGYVIRGHRHNDCFRTAEGMRNVELQEGGLWIPATLRYPNGGTVEQGFITSRNRFVGRKEARKIHDGADDILFSEDLY